MDPTVLLPYRTQIDQLERLLSQPQSNCQAQIWEWLIFYLFDFKHQTQNSVPQATLFEPFMIWLNCPVIPDFEREAAFFFIVCQSGFFTQVHECLDQILERALYLPTLPQPQATPAPQTMYQSKLSLEKLKTHYTQMQNLLSKRDATKQISQLPAAFVTAFQYKLRVLRVEESLWDRVTLAGPANQHYLHQEEQHRLRQQKALKAAQLITEANQADILSLLEKLASETQDMKADIVKEVGLDSVKSKLQLIEKQITDRLSQSAATVEDEVFLYFAYVQTVLKSTTSTSSKSHQDVDQLIAQLVKSLERQSLRVLIK